MRISERCLGTATALVITAATLTSCATPLSPTRSPVPATPASTPTPTPIFTSDADALAAATQVYRNFLRLSDDVGHDGGARPERVSKYAGDAVVDGERRQARELADAGARSFGDTKVSNSRLQVFRQTDSGVTISIYACEDLRSVDVRDQNGRSLFSGDRPDFVAYEVEVAGVSADKLRVVSNKFWTGGGVCG